MGLAPVQINFGLVANYMNARINQNVTSQAFAGGNATGGVDPTLSASARAEVAAGGTPPWRAEEDDDLQRRALSALKSGPLITRSDARRALNQTEDSPKLFMAYEALSKLQSLATALAEGEISSSYSDRAQKRITEGLEEINTFLGDSDLNAVTLLTGEKISKATSETAIKRAAYEVTTKIVHSGGESDAVAAWAGKSGFNMTLNRPDGTSNVTIDLTSLADNERTLENVTNLINTELENAGAITRFSYVEVGEEDDSGVINSDDWALKVTSTSTETINFSTTSDGPAVYMVGTSGEGQFENAQISKWTGLANASPTRGESHLLSANLSVKEIEPNIDPNADPEDIPKEKETKETPNPTRFLATATGSDGSVYALLETEGSLGEQELRSDSDIALVKYDSTGREIWTRMVGASDEITGAALAVADDGRIAIGGSTKGDLASNATGGGKDGFVIMYDSRGVETLARQQGSTFDDEVTALAFDTDGSLFVGGKTKGVLGDDPLLGGADAYIEKLDTSGSRVWINTFGTANDDAVNALAIDGAGGVVAATIEDGQAVLRSASAATFGANDWSHTVGDARIASIAYDGGALYVAGETQLDTLSGGQVSGAAQGNIDAFAMRLDVSGTNVTSAWDQSFGGVDDQSAASLLVDNGAVYLSGTGTTTFGGNATDGTQNAFLVSLDSANGAQNWAGTIPGRGGVSAASGISISSTGDNDLDAFGLPSGRLQLGDVTYVSDRTSARPGDHFFLSVDGGRDKKITLEEGDTYRALTFKINAALLLDGQATARRGLDGQTLRIEPDKNVQINLTPGSKGNDLLAALGLPEGVVYNNGSLLDKESSSDAPPLVALGLSTKDLSLEDEDSAKSVASMLDTALRGLRKAYRYAIEDPTLKRLQEGGDRPGANTGAVSAYQSARLANLQAGLNRLSAGGGGASGFLA